MADIDPIENEQAIEQGFTSRRSEDRQKVLDDVTHDIKGTEENQRGFTRGKIQVFGVKGKPAAKVQLFSKPVPVPPTVTGAGGPGDLEISGERREPAAIPQVTGGPPLPDGRPVFDVFFQNFKTNLLRRVDPHQGITADNYDFETLYQNPELQDQIQISNQTGGLILPQSLIIGDQQIPPAELGAAVRADKNRRILAGDATALNQEERIKLKLFLDKFTTSEGRPVITQADIDQFQEEKGRRDIKKPSLRRDPRDVKIEELKKQDKVIGQTIKAGLLKAIAGNQRAIKAGADAIRLIEIPGANTPSGQPLTAQDIFKIFGIDSVIEIPKAQRPEDLTTGVDLASEFLAIALNFLLLKGTGAPGINAPLIAAELSVIDPDINFANLIQQLAPEAQNIILDTLAADPSDSDLKKMGKLLVTDIGIPTVLVNAIIQTIRAIKTGGFRALRNQAGAIEFTQGPNRILKTLNEDFQVEYKLIEGSAVKPSHDPFSFNKTKGFPKGVQERNYDTDKLAQLRVIEQTQKFEPAFVVSDTPTAIDGPPVVTSAGITLGGNSRVMTIKRVYKEGRGQVYRDALQNALPGFGIDPATLSKFKEPILVRVLQNVPDDVETLRRIASGLNRSFTGGLSATERAVSTGKGLSESTIDFIGRNLADIGDEATLRELMNKKPLELVDHLVDDGVLNLRELPGLVDQKRKLLTEEGKNLIERAILGSVIDDVVLLDNLPPAVKQKISSALPSLAKIKARGGDFDFLPDLQDALEATIDSTQRNLTVDQFLTQGNLFGEIALSDRATALFRALKEDKVIAFKQKLRKFAAAAGADIAGQATLFKKPTAAQAFAEAFDVPEPKPKPTLEAKPKEPEISKSKKAIITPEDITFSNSVNDARSGEIFGEIVATGKEGKPVGVLEYSEIGDVVRIQNILVREDRRRQGIATGLMQKLREEFPAAKFEGSGLTDLGAKFKEGLKKKGILEPTPVAVSKKETPSAVSQKPDDPTGGSVGAAATDGPERLGKILLGESEQIPEEVVRKIAGLRGRHIDLGGRLSINWTIVPERLKATIKVVRETFEEQILEGVPKRSQAETVLEARALLEQDVDTQILRFMARDFQKFPPNDVDVVLGNWIADDAALQLFKLQEAVLTDIPGAEFEFLKHLALNADVQKQRQLMSATTSRTFAANAINPELTGVPFGTRDYAKEAAGFANNLPPGVDAKVIAQRMKNTIITPEADEIFNRQASNALDKGRWSSAFMEYWINALLSGPQTQVVNVTSNALFALYQIPERAVAAGVSALRGTPDGIVLSETVAQAHGVIEGVNDAWRILGYNLKKIFVPTKLGDVDVSLSQKLEGARRNAITSQNFDSKYFKTMDEEGIPNLLGTFVDMTGEVVRGPGKLLMTMDEFFKTVGYRMELRAQAKRFTAQQLDDGLFMFADRVATTEAADLKLKAKAAVSHIQKRVTEIMNDGGKTELAKFYESVVANPPDFIQAKAINAATYQTFTNTLGPTGRATTKLLNSNNFLRLVVPFFRTPVQILGRTLERTPLGVFALKGKKGAELDLAIARIVMGSIMMAWAFNLAGQGRITGNGPANRNAAAWLRTKKVQRNSWVTFDADGKKVYTSFGRLDPFGNWLSMAADVQMIWGYLDDDERQDLATAMVLAIRNNVLSKTWFRGLAEMTTAMQLNDPGRFVSKFAGSLVPNLFATIDREVRGDLRDVRTKDPTAGIDTTSATTSLLAKIIDLPADELARPDGTHPSLVQFERILRSIKTRVSWMFSEDSWPDTDIWGNVRILQGGLGPDIASPYWQSFETVDPAADEFIANKVDVGMPDDYIRGIKLTPHEYFRYKVLSGNELKDRTLNGMGAHDYLNFFITTPDYLRLTAGKGGGRSHMLRSILLSFRSQGALATIAEFPRLQKALSIKLGEKEEALTGKEVDPERLLRKIEKQLLTLQVR